MGICSAIATHIVIIFYLSFGALNHNTIVYPWNVAMICFVFLAFWRTKENSFLSLQGVQLNSLMVLSVIMVWIFPILNLFGYWDHYLSFSLYSNKPSNFYIAVERNEIHKIDGRFKNYFAEIPGLQGGEIIEINKWALSELNVPFYPEMNSFKRLGAVFCGFGIDEEKVVFLEAFRAEGKIRFNRFTCKDLKAR
jgi:hypothetical protein